MNRRNRMIVGGVIGLLILAWLYLRRAPVDTGDSGARPRAEVLHWIDEQFKNEPRKISALTRLAEAHQYIMTHADAAMDGSAKISLAMQCYFIAFPDSGQKLDGVPVYEALAMQSYNTSSRARKRLAYYGRLGGHVLSLPVIKSWERQCEQPLSD